MAHSPLCVRYTTTTIASARRPLFSLTLSHSSTTPCISSIQPRRLLHNHCARTTTSATATRKSFRSKTTSSPSLLRRPYHSTHHPDPPPHEYTNSQTTILSAALRHVPHHGFTRDALTLGARDAGFLDVSVQLFPRAEFDLILFWLASRRGLLRARVENGFFEPDRQLSVEGKIKALIMERLRMNSEIKHQWQDALALMSLAGNIPLSLSELHALSSDVLYLAGDSSVDATWYTKRMSVAAIYAAADVFMTRDASDLAATEAFVHRRVEDSKAIGDKLGGIKECLGFMGSTAVGLGRSWGLKI
ncbi:Ubiquinone biosynthesis protein coq9, mitochondrial [Aspergillus nanangensis]|uniref:Ubiquinone biosynthesis protein n=1 Tax=Aspergillus nanangensis TaxID=2582783 RepID=A0AAD4CKT8_ASPNN|nr:Ubiquinone biosynthesis protein coq9, mitochondrial [Aspergillus nanangensis]